jgi:hypothetical protein
MVSLRSRGKRGSQGKGGEMAQTFYAYMNKRKKLYVFETSGKMLNI